MILAIGFVALVGAVMWLYATQIARSRRQMDRLHEGPEDLRRADDNQMPPFDGSAGFW